MTELHEIWFTTMITDAINEAEGAISNELCWAEGASAHDTCLMHMQNAEELTEYISFLKDLYEKTIRKTWEEASKNG